tara:strand:+ start:243 stop:404 length:162 start_codon:yes stop_codon:yes gene_type:complete
MNYPNLTTPISDGIELKPLPIFNLPISWQARRESNPQPAVLETAALPIELLAF